jgi:hypothetical protein
MFVPAYAESGMAGTDGSSHSTDDAAHVGTIDRLRDHLVGRDVGPDDARPDVRDVYDNLPEHLALPHARGIQTNRRGVRR